MKKEWHEHCIMIIVKIYVPYTIYIISFCKILYIFANLFLESFFQLVDYQSFN